MESFTSLTRDAGARQCNATTTAHDAVIRLSGVNVALNGQRVLHDVTWELRRGEHWALFGPNGAGKSTFLRLVRGEIWPAPVNGGERVYNFDGKPTGSPIGVKRRMAIVSAEQQQRYTRVHGRKYGDDFSPYIPVRDIVFTGLLDSERVTRRPTLAEAAKVRQVMYQLGIDDLAAVPFDKLSQGQLRKALIARAVIGEPDALILDEVGVGLDAQSRRALLDMLQTVAERGTQILMTTHRQSELIPAITDVLELRQGRVITRKRTAGGDYNQSALTGGARQWTAITSCQSPVPEPKVGARAFLLNITQASVALDEGETVVLHDITWRMNEGEHWMILGDNGVGKTTLLKLILGELWPAHGGTIERFARDQQTQEQRGLTNVWEIKKRIGYVSTDLQTRYAADLTAEQVIATGFSASVGWPQRLTRSQHTQVRGIIERFGLNDLAQRSILEMSYGQARKVLVARALVNSPRLLILDEAFDGLDTQFRAELAPIIADEAKTAGIILVSHHDADTLPIITHRLVLEQGRITRMEMTIEKAMGKYATSTVERTRFIARSPAS